MANISNDHWQRTTLFLPFLSHLIFLCQYLDNFIHRKETIVFTVVVVYANIQCDQKSETQKRFAITTPNLHRIINKILHTQSTIHLCLGHQISWICRRICEIIFFYKLLSQIRFLHELLVDVTREVSIELRTYIAPKSIKESGRVGWWVARGWGKLTGKGES